MIEKLETRRLMSGGVNASQSGSSLTVTGGSADSQVSVLENNHTVLVHDNATGVTQTFVGVNSISISGQAKKDTIFYTGNTVGARIDGGGGNDDITIDDTGTGSSYADGNGGDDVLTVLHSHRTTVVGGGGSDQMFLNTASDVTADSEVWAYGQGGSDLFLIAGGTVHTDAGKQDEVITLP